MLGHRVLNVEDYLNILKRRWWIVAIPAVILPIVAIGATYFVTPQYVSQTDILIDQQKVPTDFVKPVATQDLDSRLAFITEQVLSRSSIQPIIEKYNLFANQHLSMDQRVDLMRDPKTLKIEPMTPELERSAGLPGFRISFTANDPQTAQQVCSAVEQLFTKQDLTSREETAMGTTDFLQGQLDDAKHTLDDMDTKVAAFDKQYAGMLPEDQANNMSILESLKSQLDALTQQVGNLEQNRSVGQALLSQQQAALSASGAPAAAAVRTEDTQQKELDTLLAEKTDLEGRYSPEYPDVIEVNRQIADLRKQMAQTAAAPPPAAPAAPAVKRPEPASIVQLTAQLHSIDEQIAARHKQQDQIQSEIRGYEARISASPQIESQYKELTRDYETAQKFYNQLLAEKNESQMSSSLVSHQEGEAFTLLDAATLPTEPIYPKQSHFAAGGLGAGIVLGMLIVALLEYKDTALRTERDIWSFTQLPTLAVIAWSGEVADIQSGGSGRLKRLFRRKPPKDLLPGTSG